MARPKSYNPEEAVSAAMRTFWELGYHQASIDILLDRLGIRRQSLYDTFESKAALFSLAMRRYSDSQMEAERRCLRSGRRPIDGLLQLVAHWSHAAAMQAGLGCLLTVTISELIDPESEVATQVREINDRLGAAIRFRLIEAAENGDIHPETDCGGLAWFLLSSRHGIMLMSRAGASGEAIRAVGQELMNRIRESQRRT